MRIGSRVMPKSNEVTTKMIIPVKNSDARTITITAKPDRVYEVVNETAGTITIFLDGFFPKFSSSDFIEVDLKAAKQEK
jgi:hypothetical protein